MNNATPVNASAVRCLAGKLAPAFLNVSTVPALLVRLLTLVPVRASASKHLSARELRCSVKAHATASVLPELMMTAHAGSNSTKNSASVCSSALKMLHRSAINCRNSTTTLALANALLSS